MKWFGHIQHIHLHRQPVDFRKSIDGLSLIVTQHMPQASWHDSAFVFCNRQYSKLKILCWDETGFVLWYKRLEQDKFKWPRKHEDSVMTLTQMQLDWLLQGLDIQAIKPHKNIHISMDCY